MQGGPKIHPIRWMKNGYGTQRIQMPKEGYSIKCGAPHYTQWVPGIQRGYVKIWYQFADGRRVVDRALTVKRAREIIKGRLPLFEVK